MKKSEAFNKTPSTINKLYQLEIGNLIKKLTTQNPKVFTKNTSKLSLTDSLMRTSKFKKRNYSSRNVENSSYYVDEGENVSSGLTERTHLQVGEISMKKENKEIQEMVRKIRTWIDSLSKRVVNFTLLENFLDGDVMKVLKASNKFETFVLHDDFLQNLFELIKLNLFRVPKYKVYDSNLETIPYAHREILDDLILQEDTSTFKIRDINWRSLTSVYEILIIVLNNSSVSSSIMKQIDRLFVENLFTNLQNFDFEERYIVKLIIHKLYGASLHFRQTFMKTLNNKLLDIIYNSNKSSDILSVNEILEILKCITCGMMTPIKTPIVSFLAQVVFPLLKNKFIKHFFASLKNFIIKICPLSKEIVNSLLHFLNMTWPVRYPERMVLYIELVETLVELNFIKPSLTNDSLDITTLFKKITSCLKDINFLISDKSLSLFKSTKFIDLVTQYGLEKSVAKNLMSNILHHWSDEIQLISKLVSAKLLNFHASFFYKIGTEEKKFFDLLDISDYKEEIWGVHFSLKAD